MHRLTSVTADEHPLDRVPAGAHDLPLSMILKVPVAVSAAPTPPSQLLIHSDRPGLYEVVEGGASLMAARKSNSPSLRVRLTHHPRWLAHKRGDATLAFVRRPEAPRRLPVTLALGAEELAPRLWHPEGPGREEAERVVRIGWGPPPARPGIGSFLRRGETGGPVPSYSDRVSWFLRGGEDADATAWLAALAALGHHDIDPKAWSALGWLNPDLPDEDPQKAPGPALAAAAISASSSVRSALSLAPRIALEWRPWGAVVGSRTSLTFAEDGARKSGPHVRSIDESPIFDHLEGLLRRALELGGGMNEAESDANATARQFERDEAQPAVARTARLSVLWDHAVARDLPLPTGSPQGLPARFGFVPSPARSLLQVFALGLTPLIIGKVGVVIGVPAPAPSATRATRSAAR